MSKLLATKWISKRIHYDGSQLHSLYGYLNHKVLGDSVISFRGSCDVSFGNMADGEDLLAKSKIQGSDMIHFIFEIFDSTLFSGVLLQRLFASILQGVITEMSGKKLKITRSGDDLYVNVKGKLKKLSISIAAKSVNSVLIHFAVNVSNKGTPVPTCCLSDFGVEPVQFAKKSLISIQKELKSIVEATQKTKSVQ